MNCYDILHVKMLRVLRERVGKCFHYATVVQSHRRKISTEGREGGLHRQRDNLTYWGGGGGGELNWERDN